MSETDRDTTLPDRGAPRVVLAMAVYNSELFLPETIRSISALDYPNLEIVMSDDASSDRTFALCQSFAASDPRVRVERHAKRLGWIGNYNSPIKHATGDYFMWVPHDDLYEAHYVRDLVALLEARPDSVLAYSAAGTMDLHGGNKGLWPGPGRMDNEGTRLRRGLRYLWWTEWQKGIPFRCIVRASALRAAGGLKPVRFAADDLWLFRLSLLGAFAYDPRPLLQKRMHAGSTSHNYGRRFGEWMEYILAHREVVREAGLTTFETNLFLAAIRLRQLWLACFWFVMIYRRLRSKLKRRILQLRPASVAASEMAPGSNDKAKR